MSALVAEQLAVEVGGRTIIENLSFTLRAGDKVGVVGRNGAGKTTLLGVLAGETPPLAGTVRRRGELGYLRQDPRLHRDEASALALSHVLSARGLDELSVRLEKRRLEIEEDPSEAKIARFSRLEEEYRALGGYSAESEVRAIASGLGLAQDRLSLSVRSLSGGERRRLELARILFGGSDVLLLDEPTNHLDSDAKTWLMKFLASYRGALMVVSHDLALLDRSITRVMHLDRDDVVLYRGTYSQYRDARAQDERRRSAVAGRQEAEIKRLSSLADAMRGSTAKRARKAKTLDTRVERLRDVAIAAPTRERSVKFRFPEPPHAGKVILTARGLSKRYGGPTVFADADVDLGRGERLLVMGLNGAGKTSLLRILAGESVPDTGTFRLGSGVSLGYYAQEHEGIRPGISVLDHVRAESRATDQDLRSLLGMFGLPGDLGLQDAGTLSGGEKTKLAIAQLVAGKRNLLLLDEPTNNLDPPSRDAIAAALSSWPGTMILVSHDVGFVRALEPDRVLLMPEARNEPWEEDLLELVALA
jgi:ATPase subunit of ABC transporter with duplicated ATPase domains